MESKEDHQRMSGNAPHLNISLCVRLWREFSWLPQIESLLTGYHSPSFFNVMQRRLTSRLYTFVLSLVRERGVAQWWKQSSPVNVVCVHIPQLMPEWMPLVGQVCCCMVLFIALGNFSTGTYNKFHNPTTSRKAAISNVNCHFNLKHTNTC